MLIEGLDSESHLALQLPKLKERVETLTLWLSRYRLPLLPTSSRMSS